MPTGAFGNKNVKKSLLYATAKEQITFIIKKLCHVLFS
jgi:hypothetical protein